MVVLIALELTLLDKREWTDAREDSLLGTKFGLIKTVLLKGL